MGGERRAGSERQETWREVEEGVRKHLMKTGYPGSLQPTDGPDITPNSCWNLKIEKIFPITTVGTYSIDGANISHNSC